MSKAYEVMTQSLATCPPEATVAHVAVLMRDRDVGDVLVMENDRLLGIVTDRDLVIHGLTNGNDPHQTPVRNLMSSKVITGNCDWSTEKIVKTMSKYQIRRLPIMDDDQVVGIISLGDIAKYEHNRNLVSKSLRSISADPVEPKTNGRIQTGALLGLGLVALTSTAIAMLTWNRSGKELSKQVADTKIYHSAQQAVSSARDKVDEAASSKTARDFRQQLQSNMKELSYQLPRVEYKPPRRKFAWFR